MPSEVFLCPYTHIKAGSWQAGGVERDTERKDREGCQGEEEEKHEEEEEKEESEEGEEKERVRKRWLSFKDGGHSTFSSLLNS